MSRPVHNIVFIKLLSGDIYCHYWLQALFNYLLTYSIILCFFTLYNYPLLECWDCTAHFIETWISGNGRCSPGRRRWPNASIKGFIIISIDAKSLKLNSKLYLFKIVYSKSCPRKGIWISDVYLCSMHCRNCTRQKQIQFSAIIYQRTTSNPCKRSIILFFMSLSLFYYQHAFGHNGSWR